MCDQPSLNCEDLDQNGNAVERDHISLDPMDTDNGSALADLEHLCHTVIHEIGNGGAKDHTLGIGLSLDRSDDPMTIAASNYGQTIGRHPQSEEIDDRTVHFVSL